MKKKYSRILLKLSGEALASDSNTYGIAPEKLEQYATDIKKVADTGIELAVVIGGGNFFRGRESKALGIARVQGDYMGMLATTINAIALQSALEHKNLQTRIMSGIHMQQVCEPFIPRRAIRHLEKGRIVIFAAGIGNPYFTTDSTASLRAIEIHAQAILKATKVDGVYSEDPLKNPHATRYSTITFQQAYEQGLQVMDMTAFTLCKENNLPIIVFDMAEPDSLLHIVQGEDIGTLIEK